MRNLLVTDGEPTRNHVVTWVVLITINPPTEIPGLRQKLDRFKTVIFEEFDFLWQVDAERQQLTPWLYGDWNHGDWSGVPKIVASAGRRADARPTPGRQMFSVVFSAETSHQVVR